MYVNIITITFIMISLSIFYVYTMYTSQFSSFPWSSATEKIFVRYIAVLFYTFCVDSTWDINVLKRENFMSKRNQSAFS